MIDATVYFLFKREMVESYQDELVLPGLNESA
jgi:hypothetical protein